MACTCGPGQECQPLKPGCWGYQAPSPNTDLDALTAAVIALTRHGVRPEIQELLIYGDPLSGVRPGALAAALTAAGVHNV